MTQHPNMSTAGTRSVEPDADNLVPDLPAINGFRADAALSEALARHGSPVQRQFLDAYGEWLGRPETRQLAAQAERQPPDFEPYDRLGQRHDAVTFGPAWGQLLAALRERGLVSLPYRDPGEGAWLTWAAGLYLHGQVDAASLCPTIMTTAAIPVLQQEPELFQALRAPLYGTAYDARDLPVAHKEAMWIGMGMTEKQGGSDLRSNTTRAEPLGEPGRGQPYRITGHKWFFSAPTADAHLVLAITAEGPGCFYLPRWRPDGTRNAIRIVRLKDKLGNLANASSEVEFEGAWGVLVGEPGRGIPTILQMATISRLACVIGSTAILRTTLTQALHHARHRQAFGRALVDQPLMRRVLADMALESEAATWLMVRLALAFERPEQPLERVWSRVVLPAAKFWICKRAVEFSGEALEVWGGNGYVETGPMARWFREAPVNSVWEGSGNVMCLDVLRALRQDPAGFEAWLETLGPGPEAMARTVAALRADLALPPGEQEAGARRIARRLVLLAQAAVLRESAPAVVAEGFLATRLAAEWGGVLGDGPELPEAEQIVARAWG